MAQFDSLPTTRLEETGRTGKRDVYSRDLRDWNFGNISFDKAIGGTLTLGGANNGNGTFALKNATGVDVITMDNTGMVVTDGTITIKDSTNTTILDATGLVSTANFANGSVIMSSDQNFSSITSFTAITGMTLTFTLSTVRTVNTLIFASVSSSMGGDFENQFFYRFTLDGAEIGPRFFAPCTFEDITINTSSSQFIHPITAGAHTLKIEGRLLSNALVSAWVYGSGVNQGGTVLGYVALGK